MKGLSLSAVVISLFSLVAGCTDGAGRRPSQLVARNALGQVVTYEQQVEAKITSADKFYNTTRAQMLEEMRNTSGERQLTLVGRMASTSASAAARSAGATAEDFRSFGEQVALATAQQRTEEEQRLRVIRNDYLASLESLELDKASLQAVRKGLEQLQADLSETEQMRRMMDAAAKMKAGYDAAVADKK